MFNNAVDSAADHWQINISTENS